MEALTDLGPARVEEIDTAGMFAEVAGLPRQLRQGYESARRRLAGAFFGTFPAVPPAEPTAVVVCGMGGSAIGADLVLACLPALAVPAAVVRGYTLPEWVNPETLVIVVSYSGQTEESLACAAQARERGCAPVCVASGGGLAAFAEAEGLPLVVVPGGGQPRAAVGSLSMPLLATLEAAGLCHEHASDVAAAAAQLEADDAMLRPECPDDENPAKSLARRLENRLAVVYGAGPTGPVARRWKGQINENAKAPAFFNELPELDHNELMGWTSLPHVTAVHASRCSCTTSPKRSASPAAPSSRRGEYEALRRSHRAGGRARGLTDRAALLAGTARRLRQLLPRTAVRRRPHAGRRHPGVQGEPRRRRRLTPGGRRRRRARPDRRGPGLPRRRRGPVPRRPAREPGARRPAAARAVPGPALRPAGRAAARRGSRTRRPRGLGGRAGGEARPGRPRTDRRPRRPGGARPAHRPLAGRACRATSPA